MEKATYKIVYGNAVEINNGFFTYTLDKTNLEKSIENVKANRESYATEEAFLRELKTRQNALEFLIANIT
jgi:hypothetical protein